MAIALPLIVELFHSLDRAVQWLSGGDADAGASGRSIGQGSQGGRQAREPQGGQGSGNAQRLCLPSRSPAQGARQWGGPLRLHPGRRVYRALQLPH